ncbi:hypothetical protein IAT38_003489 [Cryptococcus sp. DSM 104549]
MFSAAANPYDELIVKATDENLASEDWQLNIEVCDKVSSEGQNGARQAVGALQKRLSHRNPNVQLYALELANTLAQNCGKDLLGELSSRNWTSALDRLVNDRATAAPVKKKALVYIKAWAKQFEETGDPNLGIMGELYDQLRSKGHTFDEPEPTPESAEDTRRRQEEEELARVLELSKQDKGGRNNYSPYQPSGGGGSSTSHTNAAPSGNSSNVYPTVSAPVAAAAVVTPQYQPPQQQQQQQQQQLSGYQPQPQRIYSPQPLEPEPEVVDVNTATRVRAIYPFTGAELGELDFERGDIIKVLDRGFKEWWRGACNGKIGIFPVTYIEGMPEPSPSELAEEAQEEAKVFASLGLVDELLQTLKGIDPSRGDRLDSNPDIEDMYQKSVALQSQITALIKKYSDQKAELEHMNISFLRAMKQYEELRNGPVAQVAQGQPPYGYSPQAQPQPDPYAGYQQYPQQQQPQQAPGYAGQAPQYATKTEQTYPQHSHSPAAGAQVHYPQHSPALAGAAAQPGYPQQSPNGHPPVQHQPSQQFPQANPAPAQQEQAHAQAAAGYYQQHHVSTTSLQQAPTGAPAYPPQAPQRSDTEPGAAGVGAADQDANAAAWERYYQQNPHERPVGQGHPQGQGQAGQRYASGAGHDQQQQQQGQGYPFPQTGQEGQGQQQPALYGGSPYPPMQGQVQPSYAGQPGGGVEGLAGGMDRMSVREQA